eukprot:CAMPEP_0185726144 /NCGR_PEP_ID=MMETSP1171-20130828/2208_1 /TAXON_ID=374046 /ORGANISM="Helicotheca tamensis, Strain CCMP826" /LENGTH=201 /DNA_ID=CAMNT_0028394433 /DNA_START=141 /DNA_END=743 /DNA_ORIENTATION=-
MRHVLLPIEEATRCLVHSSNPLQLVNETRNLVKSVRTLPATCAVYAYTSWVSYIFCEYEIAADLVQKRWEIEKEMERKNEFYRFVAFWDGLIFVSMERKTEQDKWASCALNALSHLKHYVEDGLSNTEHKILLLEAEMARNQGEIETASSKFKLAAVAASKNELIQEEAITNERAADFFLSQGDSQAFQYYSEAHRLYLQW